jgi:hypothetical protein
VSEIDDQISPKRPSISPEKAERLRQRMASLDGKTGRGGCDHCLATYEFVTISLGESELRVYHEANCICQLQWIVQLEK